jgi:dephospho-CoA kinase
VNSIVLVDAPVNLRRERLIRDRGLTVAEADAMIAAQMPAEAKRARAQYIIDNTGTRAELHAQVDALWAALNS